MAAKIKSKIKTVNRLILNEFTFLESIYGYKPESNSKSDSLFIESLEVTYTNTIKKRSVRISYFMGLAYDELKFTFNASIYRMPYSDSEDFFSLNNYLGSINKNYSTSLINHFDKNEAVIILRKIANSLKDHASQILNGEVWLRNYYPRKD